MHYTAWNPAQPHLAGHQPPWTAAEFETRLHALGSHYHGHHPFQTAMSEGRLTREQVQGWVLNRYYYQINIPRKDAAIVANCPDPEVRRHWIQRIINHDGTAGGKGGIEAWIRLGEACGLHREQIVSQRHVLPGVRFAVDAYVNFAHHAPWQEAMCYSLTELFAPAIHRQRLAQWREKYPWIDAAGLEFFRDRLQEARQDARQALEMTLGHFRSRDQQERALAILCFKLEVRWSMLDAMYMAYIVNMPPFFNVEAG
ncbi:MAG: pyrroloquinoline-quinone synthase PqqC [Pseudomonadota bacterium]|nr:pyrroloquinoline-quinone synthase PqqC [Pseudomonadota bacterium]